MGEVLNDINVRSRESHLSGENENRMLDQKYVKSS